MWEVPLETQQSESLTNNILSQTYKPLLANYLYAALFSPITASLLKAIKKFSWRCGQASQENLSRVIFKNRLTQQWDTCTLEDKECNQLSAYRQVIQEQNKCSVLHKCGPYHNKRRKFLLRYMLTFSHHIKQGGFNTYNSFIFMVVMPPWLQKWRIEVTNKWYKPSQN